MGLVSGLEEDLVTLNASKNQIKKDLINQTNEDLTKQADNAFIEEELVEDNNSSASKGIIYISSTASKPIDIRFIRTGSQPYYKSFIASYYRQFSNYFKIINLIPVLLAGAFDLSGYTKLISIL